MNITSLKEPKNIAKNITKKRIETNDLLPYNSYAIKRRRGTGPMTLQQPAFVRC